MRNANNKSTVVRLRPSVVLVLRALVLGAAALFGRSALGQQPTAAPNPTPPPNPNRTPVAMPSPQPNAAAGAAAVQSGKKGGAAGTPTPKPKAGQAAPAKPGAAPAAGGKPGKAGKAAGAPRTSIGDAPTAPGIAVPPPENPVVEGENIPEAPAEPLPVVEDETAKVSVFLNQQPIERALDKINSETGVLVRAKGAVKGAPVTIKARDKTVPEVLNDLISGQDWTWIKRADGSYEIWDRASFIEQELRKRVIRRVFQLRHVLATDVQPALEGVKSEVGLIAANPRTNELIVTDVPDKVALMESLIREIDVPLYTQVFRIRYADLAGMQEQLESAKSPAGEMRVDPAHRLIIVTDTYDRIRQMAQLVEILDADLPMIAYNLASVGLEAADALDLVEKFIKPLATEEAMIEFNVAQSLLLVRDIPSVHQRIIDLLKTVDKSPRQVWVEGEILEVANKNALNFGTEMSYSPNLPAAILTGLVPRFGTAATATATPAPTSASGIGKDAFNPGIESPFPVVSIGGGGLRVIQLKGDLKLEIKALMQDTNSRLLLQPRALVRNGEEVVVDLITENPQVTTYFNNGFSGGTNNGYQSSTISFVPTGLTLSLTPTISNRGLIEMDVDFENSTPQFVTITTPQGPQDAVGRNQQHIQTVLIIPSGETRVLGGLISRSESDTRNGIPFLSKLPWIGGLFGQTTNDRDARNLLFFLTPTIVQEEPEYDLVATPINQAADQLKANNFSTTGSPGSPGGPNGLNPLPDQLKDMLRRAEPVIPQEGAPGDLPKPLSGFPESGSGEGSTSPITGGPGSAMRIEPAPSGASAGGAARLNSKGGTLMNEPAPPDAMAHADLGFTGPGATALDQGVKGPAGAVSPGQRATVGQARRPTPVPAAPGGPGGPAPGNPNVQISGQNQPGQAGQPGQPQPGQPQPGQPQPGQPQPGQPQPGQLIPYPTDVPTPPTGAFPGSMNPGQTETQQ